jgi:hypothetical protein
VQFFQGVLHYRCAPARFTESAHHPSLPNVPPFALPEQQPGDVHSHSWSWPHAHTSAGTGAAPPATDVASGQAAYDTEQACSSAAHCAADEACGYFDETPNNGLLSFDSVGHASVILLQVNGLTPTRAQTLTEPNHKPSPFTIIPTTNQTITTRR